MSEQRTLFRSLFAPRVRWQARQTEEAQFRADRQLHPQSDEEFLSRAAQDANDAEQTVILAARHVIARYCGVDANALHADDETTQLQPLIGPTGFVDFFLAVPEGLDIGEFFFELTKTVFRGTGKAIRVERMLRRRAIERWAAGETLGAWAAFIANEMMHSKEGSAGKSL